MNAVEFENMKAELNEINAYMYLFVAAWNEYADSITKEQHEELAEVVEYWNRQTNYFLESKGKT